MRSVIDVVSRLLEWTDEEAQKFAGYYQQYRGKLADSFESAGYTLSLWLYPDERIYEVNINYRGLDFTDPEVQRRRQSVTGYMPTHHIAGKLREWFQRCGHLAMGSHDPRKVALYKRLFARELGGRIEDVTGDVPGGGHYFVVIGWDHDVMNRLHLAGPEQPVVAGAMESVDPKDFILDNPTPYEVKRLSDEIVEVYDLEGKLVGKVYDGRHDIPPEAHQFWRDNPWMAVTEPPDHNPESFKTEQQAIEWLARLRPSTSGAQ